MVTREAVVWAYRLMVGREPESEAAIEAFCQFQDIETLRQAFLRTEEFAITNKVTWLRGYWVAAPVMSGKYLMWIDLGDRYMSFGCLLDNYEPAETQLMKTVLKPGDVVVDAGANLGWFTLVASMIVGNTGHVHAFEPRPETADYLEKTVALNRLGDRVAVHRCGLSNAKGDGILAWWTDTDNPGGSFLSQDRGPHQGMEHQPIALRPLDDLALSRLDFLKVDVEGAEMQLFRGARQTLERCRPVILSELNPPMLQQVSGVAVEEYFAFFNALGYRCFIIDLERCGEEVRGFPDDWYKPLINLALLPQGSSLDRLAAALPGLPKAREAQTHLATDRTRQASILPDTVTYQLTHSRQLRAEATGDASTGDRASMIKGISAMPAAFRRLGSRGAADWQKWPKAAGAALRTAGARLAGRGSLSPRRVATALYRGILDREPDRGGLAGKVSQLRSGAVLADIIRSFITSQEFRSRTLRNLVPSVDLPDLTRAMPEMYETQDVGGSPVTVYNARTDADIVRMESLITRHRYYDRFGVGYEYGGGTPIIDLDKEVTAAVVRGLGARTCFELGCFTGPVLSLLADAGVSVTGADVSHAAFAFAYPNIRDRMLFGDLLGLDIDGPFDVVLCMDVLEHVIPLRVGDYIEKVASLVSDDGFVYMNSPMYGSDEIFGTCSGPYLEEWRSVGDASYWRQWHCDDKGWPIHGHVVWASPAWWTRILAEHGLVRDRTVEMAIHRRLAPFFEQAQARRSQFVLRRTTNSRDSATVAAEVEAALARVPGLPQA